jgi:hypothetical protein
VNPVFRTPAIPVCQVGGFLNQIFLTSACGYPHEYRSLQVHDESSIQTGQRQMELCETEGVGVIRFRVVLQATRFGRHSERSEESLFVLNCQEAEGFLTSFGMTDSSFSPNRMTPLPNRTLT